MTSYKKKMLAGLGMLGIASAMIATSASASEQAPPQLRGIQNDAVHQQIHQALLSNDYTAFKAAIAGAPKPPNAPEITEAVFAKMVEAEKLRQKGDHEGAKKIMESIGFSRPEGKRGGPKSAPPNLTDAQKTAWEQAHTLMQQGKRDEAKKILDAAGITPPTHHQKTATS